MIPCIAALVLAQPSPIDDRAVVGYSGIPEVTGPNLVVQSHNVTLQVTKDHVDVSSTTLIRNTGPAGTVEVDLPTGALGGADAPTNLVATWVEAPVTLNAVTTAGHTGYTATVPIQDRGSYALRVKFTEPIGRAGLDHKQRIAVYGLASPVPIGQLQVSYAYEPGIVFHLPVVGPERRKWQVGHRGAFLRVNHYDGKLGPSYCAFYPEGFGNGGG